MTPPSPPVTPFTVALRLTNGDDTDDGWVAGDAALAVGPALMVVYVILGAVGPAGVGKVRLSILASPCLIPQLGPYLNPYLKR